MSHPRSRGGRIAAIAVALAISALTAARPALAEGDDADALFTAGRELMQQGRFSEACPKFAQSQRVLPAVGTALNLGLCLEKLGHNASAVAAYREAITMAAALGPAEAKRITVARDRLSALEPRVPKLQIVVGEDVPGLEVKRDGLAFAKSQFGVSLPVDPIPHVVEASAPGKQPWRTTVAVTGDAATVVVTVPALVDAPPPVAAAAAPAARPSGPPSTEHSRPVVLTAVLAGTGLVALTAGVVLALDAKSKYDDADSLCDARGCAPQAASIQDSARGRGNVATIAFVVGGLALAGAAVVWFVVPGPVKTGGTSLRVGAGPSSLALGGAF